MGARRRCCCGCPEYSDDFNREDNEDPGPNWPLTIGGDTAQIGDWDILDNQFYSEGTSNSIAIYKTALPDNWMLASAKIVDEQLGGVYRVIVSWKNMQNYLYGEYERVDQTNARISVHQVIGGVESELDYTEYELSIDDQSPPDDCRTLNVCVDPKLFIAFVDSTSTMCRAITNGVEVEDGLRAGVGHDNSSFANKFDDFWMMEEYGERHQPDCPLCDWCYCEGELLPFTLLATIQGNDDCDTLDGISCVLTGLKCGAGTLWYGVIDDDSCLDGWAITLTCGAGDNDDVSGWTLKFSAEGSMTPCGGSDALLEPEEGGTCNPMNLWYCIKYEDIAPTCPEACWPCGDGGPAEGDGHYVDFCIYITEVP